MKTNNKTKRFAAKKVASYDMKLIWIIVAAIAVVTIGIITALAINTALNSYVAHINGKGIRDYEYEYFLQNVMSEMQEEAQSKLGEDETFDAKAFWTDTKKKEAKDAALEDVVKWQSQYLVSVDKGFKLTSEETENVKNNIDYQVYYYYTMYTQYGYTVTYDDILSMMGIKDLDQYKAILLKTATISKYADDLANGYKIDDLYFTDKDGNKTTGEQAVNALYNSDVDAYRRVQLQTLVIAKKDAPTKPTEVKDPGEAPDAEDTSEEYISWKADKDKYDKYVKDLEQYNTNLEKYNTENAEFIANVKSLYEVLSTDGKYTGKGFAEVATEEKDADGNAIKAIKEYTDATLEDIAGTEGALYSSTKGLYSFIGSVDTTTDFLTKYAVSLDWVNWTDATSTEIKSSLTEPAEKEEGEESKEEEKDPYENNFATSHLNELKLFEDDDYYYITKCVNILDINTSREDAPEDEDAEYSVRATIVEELKANRADDDIDAEVAANASKFKITKKRENVMDEAVKNLLGF